MRFRFGNFILQGGQQYLEVTEEGIMEMIPVKVDFFVFIIFCCRWLGLLSSNLQLKRCSQVNANLKADTTEALLGRKKSMHLSALKYRIDEIKNELLVCCLCFRLLKLYFVRFGA